MAPRVKLLIGGIVILAAVAFLIFTSTQANAQYFMTVDELAEKSKTGIDRTVTVSGAVLGDTIRYDPNKSTVEFTVANVPGDNSEIDRQGGLAKVLHDAVVDTSRSRLKVVYEGAKPDLLKNEAQAIMTGHLGPDGVFYANELLLKCPTKYEEAVPQQAQGN